MSVQFAEYLKQKKILIVDPSSTTRASALKGLTDLGATRDNIFYAKDFNTAVAEMDKHKPGILITEYNLDLKFGLDLLQIQAQYLPKPQDRLFILLTKNSNESSVAEAAEEDVDAFILKPYSQDELVKNLQTAILQKVNVTEYRKTIQTGKEYFVKSELPQAVTSFEKAKGLDKQPMLACYYLAHTHQSKKDYEAALTEYRSGLKFNPIHYKCLAGEFELLDQMDKKTDAYKVMQTLVQHFPVSPQRLGKIFSLAVYTRNFTDVDKYYDIFTTIEHRSPELTRIVFGGLFICGKYLLQKGNVDHAEKIFTKLAASSGRNEVILQKIVNTCVEFNLFQIADNFLRMFSLESRETLAFKHLDFHIATQLSEPGQVINKGLELISAQSDDPFVYETVACLLMDARRMQVAEEVIYKAAQKFPERKNDFLSLIDAA